MLNFITNRTLNYLPNPIKIAMLVENYKGALKVAGKLQGSGKISILPIR